MNASRASTEPKRVAERRQAAALARHYREAERLSVTEIAARLGRKPATVRSYLYDPDASKARELKKSYRGSCEGCGTPTSGGDGPSHAKALCPRCRGRVSSTWSRERIERALRAWCGRYGEPALSTDLSRNYAERYGGERLRRLEAGWEGGPWPSLGVVQYHFGTVAKANNAALAG
jgi:5-methylcytosine-specific restriction endonuclease McrA